MSLSDISGWLQRLVKRSNWLAPDCWMCISHGYHASTEQGAAHQMQRYWLAMDCCCAHAGCHFLPLLFTPGLVGGFFLASRAGLALALRLAAGFFAALPAPALPFFFAALGPACSSPPWVLPCNKQTQSQCLSECALAPGRCRSALATGSGFLLIRWKACKGAGLRCDPAQPIRQGQFQRAGP